MNSFIENFPLAAVVLITLFILVAAAGYVSFLKRLNPKKARHSENKRKAEETLERLRGIRDTRATRQYLVNKVSPYVFEELILTAFRDCKVKIKRNQSYSGDGGIDGKIKIHGKWHYIQAKCYQGNIRKKDAVEFWRICKKHGKSGIFIHTGTESEKTSTLINNDTTCSVKGEDLTRLLDRSLRPEKRIPKKLKNT